MPSNRILDHRILNLSARLETRYDAARERVRGRLGLIKAARVYPYLGFGTSSKIYLEGRVLEDTGVAPPTERDTFWDNFKASYKRFRTYEVSNLAVRARFEGKTWDTRTDREGYFHFEIDPPATLPSHRKWHHVQLEADARRRDTDEPATAIGKVLVPPATSEFGVISDIDDTILRTQATNFLKMVRLTFLHNARTRLPFEGVAAFYRALQRGVGPDTFNPIFYVSSSPWNLYDLLLDFMEVNEIPEGPLFLRDLGLERNMFIKSSHGKHKRAYITRLLDTYPDLPFVLIGDSGQHDPEIYASIALDRPGRIRAVYIRDFSPNLRDREVDLVARNFKAEQVAYVRVSDSRSAAEHAARIGLLRPESLDDVARDRARDAEAPGDVEALIKTI